MAVQMEIGCKSQTLYKKNQVCMLKDLYNYSGVARRSSKESANFFMLWCKCVCVVCVVC